MNAVLIRTGSVPVQMRNTVPGSHRSTCLRRTDSLSGENVGKVISLISGVHRRRDRPTIRRTVSEIKMSDGFTSFPARILEEDDQSRGSRVSSRPKIGIPPVEEIGFHGGGSGNGSNSGESHGGGEGFEHRSGLGEYYEKTLRKNPNDPLLLRNYGKYLYEVVGDSARAEECYCRAILTASDGGDGELFSMYGRLIWETQRDEERAKSYFDQAVSVSPDDCTVLGSYAHFIWEAEEDKDESKAEMTELPSEVVPAL